MNSPPHAAELPILKTDDSIAVARARHLQMLALAIGILLLAFALRVRPDQRVELRWLPGWTAPEACSSRVWFGIECPGCGLTRGFIRLAEGNVSAAWRLNPASWLLSLAVVFQLPYRSLALMRVPTLERFSQSAWPAAFGWVLIVALIGQWLLRVPALLL